MSLPYPHPSFCTLCNRANPIRKRHPNECGPKTVNNVLTVLNMLLKSPWNGTSSRGYRARSGLLPIPKPSAGFYDVDEYERLVEAAQAIDPNTYLIVLLGGEAGPAVW